MTQSYYKNKHSCYLLQYHLVLVTKYRHPVLVKETKDFLINYTEQYFKDRKINILEINTDVDHIHILFEAPPQIRLSDFVNAYKSASSRHIRKLFAKQLAPYYWKPYFWSLSYFICSASERATELITNYIKNQGAHSPTSEP